MNEYTTESIVIFARELIAAAKIAKTSKTPGLHVVRVERKDRVLTIAATDGYKIVRYKHETDKGEPFIVTFDALEVAKSLKVSDVVTIHADRLETGAVTLSSSDKPADFINNSKVNDMLFESGDEGQFVCFNPVYAAQIMDAFKNSSEYRKSEREKRNPNALRIELHGELRPVTFRSQAGTFEAVLMPVRIS